jgi:hypothetical protein
MDRIAPPFACVATLAAALVLGGCSSASSREPSDGSSLKPGATSPEPGNTPPEPGGTTSIPASLLVGTWTYGGDVPDVITVRLTFNADKTFTFDETVAPRTTPAHPDAGDGAAGCVASDSYQGTYDTTNTAGVNTLAMNFTSCTANIVSGCTDASLNTPGQAEGQDGINAFRDQGLLPAPSEAYQVTATTLVLTPPKATGLGLNNSATTFTKAP